MDNLCWDESLAVSNCYLYSTASKMGLQEPILSPIHEQPQETHDHFSHSYLDSAANVTYESVQLQNFAPVFDSVDIFQNLNLTHVSQEEALVNPLCSNPMTDFDVSQNYWQTVNGFQEGKAGGANSTATGSLESLDCLLSTENNSKTNTLVEDDDEISMAVLSNCTTFWNKMATVSTLSSGESACKHGVNRHEPADQTVSQISSDHHQYIKNKTRSAERPLSSKRTNDQIQLKPTGKSHFFDILHHSNHPNSATEGSRFQLIPENPPKSKRTRSDRRLISSSSNINFQQPSCSSVASSIEEADQEAIAQMKEMIYRAAAFRPVDLGMEIVEKPKRKNVKISSDPQTVAARQRRERISEKIRILQRLVPGGSKMDTASMLDEAANYLKFLRSQVKALESLGHHKLDMVTCPSINLPLFSSSIPSSHSFPPMQNCFPFQNPNSIYLPKS